MTSLCTQVVFVTLHVVGEGGAAQLVGAEEAEVPGHFSGNGGGQALEEALRTLVPHDGLHHRPHRAADRGVRSQSMFKDCVVKWLCKGL